MSKSSAKPVASRSGRVPRPAPILANPSNVAKPFTSSHRVAVLQAEAERKAAAIAADIAQRLAAEDSPSITPPPEIPSTAPASASTSTKRRASPSVEVAEDENHDGSQSTQKSKRPHVDGKKWIQYSVRLPSSTS